MKIHKIHTCLIIIALLLYGCTSKRVNDPVFNLDFNNIINSNIEIKSLSSIASEIDYVVLETTQESLINQIYSIVKIPKGYLIQDSQKQLLFFDNNGTFGWKIESQGRGPNEFSYIASFDYNFVAKELVIHSRSDLLIYDLNGKHIETIKIGERLNNIKCLPNGDMIGISSDPKIRKLITINQDGEIVNEQIFYSNKPDESPVITSYPLLAKHDNQVLFMNMDTIWQTTNGFDYKPIIRTFNAKEGEPFRIRKFLDNYLLVTYTFNRIRAIVDYSTGEYFICTGNDKYGLVDDFHSGPTLYPGVENYGLILNSISPASIMNSDIKKELLPEFTGDRLLTIGENNNPILRVIRLKNQIDIN